MLKLERILISYNIQLLFIRVIIFKKFNSFRPKRYNSLLKKKKFFTVKNLYKQNIYNYLLLVSSNVHVVDFFIKVFNNFIIYKRKMSKNYVWATVRKDDYYIKFYIHYNNKLIYVFSVEWLMFPKKYAKIIKSKRRSLKNRFRYNKPHLMWMPPQKKPRRKRWVGRGRARIKIYNKYDYNSVLKTYLRVIKAKFFFFATRNKVSRAYIAVRFKKKTRKPQNVSLPWYIIRRLFKWSRYLAIFETKFLVAFNMSHSGKNLKLKKKPRK